MVLHSSDQGTYYIVVTAYFDDGTGAFALSVECSDPSEDKKSKAVKRMRKEDASTICDDDDDDADTASQLGWWGAVIAAVLVASN